jgi:tripartite-type tricarboxylate transporter receptor subunit TctC
MKKSIGIQSLAKFIIGFIFLLMQGFAIAQSFPEKPIKFVITYPPGGSSDIIARTIATKLSKLWGQPIVPDYKPGAGGAIGMEFAAQQPGDGYTIVLGNFGPSLVNPLINKVNFNMEKDFIPVSVTTLATSVLVVSEKSPYKNLNDLITAAKQKPDGLNFATSGPGSISDIATELMMRESNIKMAKIPYKGTVPAINDLLGGQVDMMISDVYPVAQFIKSGRLRALAVTSQTRSKFLNTVPTFAEQGYPGVVALTWWGIFLPAKTPPAIQEKYSKAIIAIMNDPEIKDNFNNLSVEAAANTQEEFKAFLAAETVKYTKLVNDNKIKGD